MGVKKDRAAGPKGKKSAAAALSNGKACPGWYCELSKGSVQERCTHVQERFRALRLDTLANEGGSDLYLLAKSTLVLGLDVLSGPNCSTRSTAKVGTIQYPIPSPLSYLSRTANAASHLCMAQQ